MSEAETEFSKELAAAMKATPDFELPEELRIPLHSLQADMRTLVGRVALDGSTAGMICDAILSRLSQIETAAYGLCSLAERGVKVLEKAGRDIKPYLEWTVGPESPAYHPTMPSAVAAFLEALGASS